MNRWIIGGAVLLELAMAAGAMVWVVRRKREGQPHGLNRVDVGREGPHFVFLHGLGGTHRYWLRAFEGFRPLARLTFIDLLGFGDSPRPWCRHTVDRHLEQLHERLANDEVFTLVGHSLGAALAIAYAARYPTQVRRLVLLSLPHFGGEAAAYRWLRQTPEGWILTNIILMSIACVITRRLASGLLPYLRPDLPREVAQDIVKHSWAASTTSLWDVIYRHDLQLEADALSPALPVTCIHGARDMTVPADRVERLAAGRRRWQAVVLPTVDHHPWLREPGRCRDLVFGSDAASTQ